MNGGKDRGGKGGKGWGKGKGKGKGGEGVYGLDLMGYNSWGGDEYYDPTYDYAIRSVDSTYGRTLAAFGPAPIAISDRFRPIAEEPETTGIAVPIADLIVQRPRKRKIKGRNTLKPKFAHPSVCECCPKPIDKPADTKEPEIITFTTMTSLRWRMPRWARACTHLAHHAWMTGTQRMSYRT
jgi:hypothetical protein